MGANATREAQAIYGRCSTMYSPQEMKELKDMRRPEASPRDLKRSGLRERQMASTKSAMDSSCQTTEDMNYFDRALGAFVEAAPLDADGFAVQDLAPDSASSGYVTGAVSRGQGGYNSLNLQDEDEKPASDDPERELTKGRCSTQMISWHDDWLHSVECGELDIYTCLGLSNAFTFTPDTRKIIAKVIGVCVLQLLVPCILLKVELDAGFSYKPSIPGLGFRMMGCCLYLYSLYSMYNNALDECRSTLLQWAFDQNVPSGHWLPMMFGEITNVFVSLILVLTLFVIFVDVEHPADLILNAVAVNFLGAVDGEFVDDEMKQDALRNFREVFYEYGSDMQDNDDRKEHHCLNVVLSVLLTVIVVSGLFLAVVFLLAPSPEHTESANVGRQGYPKLI